jgi:hypothetical protein
MSQISSGSLNNSFVNTANTGQVPTQNGTPTTVYNANPLTNSNGTSQNKGINKQGNVMHYQSGGLIDKGGAIGVINSMAGTPDKKWNFVNNNTVGAPKRPLW